MLFRAYLECYSSLENSIFPPSHPLSRARATLKYPFMDGPRSRSLSNGLRDRERERIKAFEGPVGRYRYRRDSPLWNLLLPGAFIGTMEEMLRFSKG